MDILMEKILERQRLEARPMATLDPRLHPKEVMELELLSRLKRPNSAPKTHRGPYQAPPRPRPRPKALQLEGGAKKERVEPQIPLGVEETLALESMNRLGAQLSLAFLPKELSKAYRKLAFELHPDRSSHPEARQLFGDLTKAYQLLRAWAQKAYPFS